MMRRDGSRQEHVAGAQPPLAGAARGGHDFFAQAISPGGSAGGW